MTFLKVNKIIIIMEFEVNLEINSLTRIFLILFPVNNSYYSLLNNQNDICTYKQYNLAYFIITLNFVCVQRVKEKILKLEK